MMHHVRTKRTNDETLGRSKQSSHISANVPTQIVLFSGSFRYLQSQRGFRRQFIVFPQGFWEVAPLS